MEKKIFVYNRYKSLYGYEDETKEINNMLKNFTDNMKEQNLNYKVISINHTMSDKYLDVYIYYELI